MLLLAAQVRRARCARTPAASGCASTCSTSRSSTTSCVSGVLDGPHDRVRRPPARALRAPGARDATAATSSPRTPGYSAEMHPGLDRALDVPDRRRVDRRDASRRARRRADVRPPLRLVDDEDVEVVVHADHPTLNRAVAELLAARRAHRRAVDALEVRAVAARSGSRRSTTRSTSARSRRRRSSCARFDGELLSVPRYIDVRVLWSRVPDAPSTWDDLAASDVVFGFPGRESGLFGTFFELVVSSGRPAVRRRRPSGDRARRGRRGGRDAVRARAPRAGRPSRRGTTTRSTPRCSTAASTPAAAWPGGYGPIRDSGEPLEPAPVSVGGISYAGVPLVGDPDDVRRRRRRASRSSSEAHERGGREARRERRDGARARRGLRGGRAARRRPTRAASTITRDTIATG